MVLPYYLHDYKAFGKITILGEFLAIPAVILNAVFREFYSERDVVREERRRGVDSTSTGLIEEELGRYNQLKVGRIDSMLSILEERNIMLMYAIWPHDLFSETVWAAQWKHNPYSQLVDAEEV